MNCAVHESKQSVPPWKPPPEDQRCGARAGGLTCSLPVEHVGKHAAKLGRHEGVVTWSDADVMRRDGRRS